MERFNISKITTDKDAIAEMDYQYSKMLDLNSTGGRAGRFYNMLALYEKFPCLKTIWVYVEEAYQYVKKFVRRIISNIREAICGEGHDYFYIMRVYHSNGRHWFDKVGSTNNPERRKKQHANYYGVWNDNIETLLCVDTGNIPASSLEDKVRSYFIRKYGNDNFLPKDRFTCMVDIEDIKAKIPNCLKALQMAEII
jgi:hypothetical protein